MDFSRIQPKYIDYANVDECYKYIGISHAQSFLVEDRLIE
jgi:hypothetical protein